MIAADEGRAAVYEAERSAIGGTALERRHSVDDLARLVAAVCTGPWWSSAGGPVVRIGPARSNAVSSSASEPAPGGGREVAIRVAAGQRDAATVCHELAHALAGIGAGHGPRFRAAHVDVVAIVAGTEAAAALAAAYVRFGVPPGPRPWPRPHLGEGPGFVRLPPPAHG